MMGGSAVKRREGRARKNERGKGRINVNNFALNDGNGVVEAPPSLPSLPLTPLVGERYPAPSRRDLGAEIRARDCKPSLDRTSWSTLDTCKAFANPFRALAPRASHLSLPLALALGSITVSLVLAIVRSDQSGSLALSELPRPIIVDSLPGAD